MASNLRTTATSAIRWGAFVALLGGCAFADGPTYPRPTIELHDRGTTPAGPPQLESFTDHGAGRASGVLTGSGETVRFQLRRVDDSHLPRPLVLVVPILAGGEDLMDQVAQRMHARGFDVAFCARAGSALKAPQRARELNELFRRTVLHQRLLLAWLRGPDQVAPTATFALGMSMGGMVTTVLAAVEPELDGIAICLSGGDLAGLVLASGESRVQKWVEWRKREDGVGRDHLQWELQQYLHYEPLAFARAVPSHKVLLVTADFDTVVPRRNQDLLWEALGRPARLRVPLGHYSAALAIDPILSAAAAHFRARLPSQPTGRQPS